jgi:predicted permease
MILTSRRSVVMTEAGLPEAVNQEDFSPNAFQFFGVPSLFGRTFSPQDASDESKAEPAVLSYLFWQRHFSGRRDVLGEQIRLNDKFFTIIGVLPVRFTWNDADVYVPMELHPGVQGRFVAVLKVRPGVPKEQINAEFQSFHEKFSRTAPPYIYPEAPFRTEFMSVNEGILGKFANTLLALLAAVGFLLLIACANVANLLLARASARQGEIAVRVALGAGRRRVIQQLLTESVILSVTGGVLGIALAYGGVKAVVALMPEYSVPHEAVIAINLPVLGLAVAASVATGLLFGLAPAVQLSRPNQATFLKAAGRDAGAGAAGDHLRNVLIVSEVTLSLVLLTGAALAAAGMLGLTKLKLGYQPKGVLTMFVFAPASHYPQWSQRRAFFTDIIERLRKLPSAESVTATLTGAPPYTGAPSNFNVDGLPSTGAKIRVNLVSESYFSTLQIPLLKGRYFDAADVARVNPIAVVTEDLVKKYFPPGQDPMGRQISLDLFTGTQPTDFIKSPQNPHVFQIVGVCGNTRNSGLRDTPEPAVYLPFSTIFPPGMMFMIRTSKPDPLALSDGARQAVSAVDPTQPIAYVHTLDYFLRNETAYPRFATFLFGIFGAIGLTLACTGIFSVVSYAVSRRTREFGIRMALGATPGNVLRLVIRSTGRVLVVGFALGAILSVVSSRALAGKLAGIGIASPSMLVGLISVLAVAALLACSIPARSATKVQPVDALRHE